VVAHQPRHEHVRQPEPALRAEIQELVAGHLRGERPVLILAPAGQEPVETDRVDHGARQDVGADLRALLDHHNGEVRPPLGGELAQADRRREARRARADHHHVEIHRFTGGQIHGHGRRPPGRRPATPGRRDSSHMNRRAPGLKPGGAAPVIGSWGILARRRPPALPEAVRITI
jgi:hypothetical protein